MFDLIYSVNSIAVMGGGSVQFLFAGFVRLGFSFLSVVEVWVFVVEFIIWLESDWWGRLWWILCELGSRITDMMVW